MTQAASPRAEPRSPARPEDVRPPGPPPRRGDPLSRIRTGLAFYLDAMGLVGGRFRRYGDVYFVGSADGSQPGLFAFRHPDHLEEIFITKARAFDKGHSAFQTIGDLLGRGLLNTDGETWRRQRRLLQPAFTRQRLEQYAEVMVQEADATARSFSAGREVDVSGAMMEMTLKIVCRTLFGHDASSDARTVRVAMEQLQGAIGGIPIPLPDLLNPAVHRRRRAKSRLDEIIYRLIDGRRPGAPHDDLLQRLVDAEDEDGSRLDRQEVRDQLVTLFLAGHETTSTALTWTFHLLGEHPEIRARMLAELGDVLGGRSPTAADLPRLEYTDRVFSEAMRLYPPIYVLSRRVVEDVQIGGWHLPAGSELVTWIWHTHRDPRWWDEPWAFRPDRFTKAASEGRPRLAYLPYGAGPRACIGKVFAQMEGVLALATISQLLRLESTGDGVELQPRVTLTPAGGLTMRVEPR